MKENYSQLLHILDRLHQQRRSGLLQVEYPSAPASFYFKDGELVDAQLGATTGVEAVYLALSLPDAFFSFDALAEPTRLTINAPWQQIRLEGIRRLKQQTVPTLKLHGRSTQSQIGPMHISSAHKGSEYIATTLGKSLRSNRLVITELSQAKRRKLVAALCGAVLLSTAVLGVITQYHRENQSSPQSVASSGSIIPVASSSPSPEATSEPPAAQSMTSVADHNLDVKKKIEKEEQADRTHSDAKQLKSTLNPLPSSVKANISAPLPKETLPLASTAAQSADESVASGSEQQTIKIEVQIENGRVSQASVVDHRPGTEAYEAAGLRIARERRYPTNFVGKQTVLVRINPRN